MTIGVSPWPPRNVPAVDTRTTALTAFAAECDARAVDGRADSPGVALGDGTTLLALALGTGVHPIGGRCEVSTEPRSSSSLVVTGWAGGQEGQRHAEATHCLAGAEDGGTVPINSSSQPAQIMNGRLEGSSDRRFTRSGSGCWRDRARTIYQCGSSGAPARRQPVRHSTDSSP